MVGFGSPDNINGLTLWWDAADASTVNDGTVTANQNVYKIVDKVSGVALTNSQGASGPTYAIAAINGNNAIHMPYYAPNQIGLKALSNSSVTQITSAQKTLVFVFKPTTLTTTTPAPVTKYALSIWGSGRIIGNNFPSIHLFSGSGFNPYCQYGEVPGSLSLRNINSWNYRSLEYALKTNQPIDLGSTQILILRTKSGISKFNWLHQGGFDTKTEYYINTSSNTGEPVIPTSPAKLVIGSYNDNLSPRANGAHPIEGFFCEMLYYNRYLTTAETNALEQYIKMKWLS
jgi:hypothetical protein